MKSTDDIKAGLSQTSHADYERTPSSYCNKKAVSFNDTAFL
ncbi:MAG TPA: hypothetical protein VL093_08545 [Flavipsychrobacter sp.]|jgi:hypothetical protein|nr:hypothetical protein [Flavipsychrobacter sp.]